ncbi:chemotaxis protein CheW [Methylomicrobium lacus]|uniref:chemotaxis protein CheW n=1 Tax=Methylomicrobium lacus TaxID=136992 RepID=UPI0035A92ACA
MNKKFPSVDEHKVEKSAIQHFMDNWLMPLANEELAFGIRIGRIGFIVPSSHYCELIDQVYIKRLPNVAPWISGLLNLGGNDVPVFDLHEVISEELPDPDIRWLCLIGEGANAAALWIDGVMEAKGSELFQPVKDLAVLPVIQFADDPGNRTQRGQVWFKMNFEDLFETLGDH